MTYSEFISKNNLIDENGVAEFYYTEDEDGNEIEIKYNNNNKTFEYYRSGSLIFSEPSYDGFFDDYDIDDMEMFQAFYDVTVDK